MSSTDLKIVFVVASGLLLLGSSLAMAQQSRRVAKTCAGQVETMCPKQPGRGSLQECVKMRQTELSGSCRAEVELVVSIVKACADDRRKLCPGLKSGNAVRECMKSHMGDLGNICKTALAKAETGNK
jgi:hypothetical protein